MNKARKAIALGAIALSASACNMPGTYWDADKGAIQIVQLHAEWELDRPHNWDIDPPARLDIIMFPDEMEIYWEDGNEIGVDKRCARMGGELIWYPKTMQFICEGIDY